MENFEFFYDDIWTKTLNKIVESGQIEEVNMPYFKSKLESMDDNEARVRVDTFINCTIMNNNLTLIEACLQEVTGRKLKVRVYQKDEISPLNPIDPSINNVYISRQIDPNQTFGNFVTGRSNAQAHLASMTCANNLGIVYNPLFIYGNSGLGKTHLLNAIGNQVMSLYPSKKIGIISGIEFVEGVAEASKNNKLDDFKKSFYDLDLLLVDDIQFIAGKDKTHEIFFTVFNNLINNKKQVCITADKTPSDIKGLEERIISRFNQGLTVNIDTPEYETSINILKMEIKNGSSPIQCDDVDEDVLNYIATNFSHDVRSLKGAITRLLFYSIDFLNNQGGHINLELAVDAFKDQIKENNKELSIISIKKAVCNYYGLTRNQIESSTRTKNIANPRHIAMYLCRKMLDAPYKEIGDEFGGRDHSTVMSACEKVEHSIQIDPLYSKAINDIETRIVKNQ